MNEFQRGDLVMSYAKHPQFAYVSVAAGHHFQHHFVSSMFVYFQSGLNKEVQCLCQKHCRKQEVLTARPLGLCSKHCFL